MITISNTGTHKVEIAGYGPEEETAYTPLEFLRMFTMAERKLMKDSTNDVVIDFLWLADKASYVSLADTDTISAINYFVTLNILTSARATEILNG